MALTIDGVQIQRLVIDGVDQTTFWIDGVQVFSSGPYSTITRLKVSTPPSPDSPVQFDRFGWDADTDGTTIVVGAPYRDNGANGTGTDEGYAYVFEKISGTWTFTQKLQASDFTAASGDLFGQQCIVDGNTIFVSAPNWTNGFGKLYVFEKIGSPPSWTEVQTMVASDPSQDDLLGRSISLSGTTLVVGADVADTPGNQSGAVYIFEKAGTWPGTETQKLIASDSAAGEWFGTRVFTDGTTIAISSGYGDVGGTSDAGAIYVFEHDGSSWVEVQKMTHVTPIFDGRLGIDLHIEGNIIYGASWRDNSDTGAISIFEKSGTWPANETGKIVYSASVPGNLFGTQFSFENTTLVAGGGNAGGLIFYELTGSPPTWMETGKVLVSPNDPTGSIANVLSNGVLLNPDTQDAFGGDSSGAVFVYD